MADKARSNAGFRHCVVFELAADNTITIPDQGSDVAYEGVVVSGVKALTLTDPPARQIAHTGDDGVIATMNLPPNTAPSGTLTTAKTDDLLEALLTPVKAIDMAGGTAFGIGTDQKGNENYVAMLAYAQAVNTTKGSANYGQTMWEAKVVPMVKMVPQDPGFSDAPITKTYQLFPQVSQMYPWGLDYTTAQEGYQASMGMRWTGYHRPKIISFKGNNSRTSFTLPTNYPAAALSASDFDVYVDGVKTTVGVTLTASALVFNPAPADAVSIHLFYQTDYD